MEIKRSRILLTLVFLSLLVVSSCKKDDPEPVSTVPLSIVKVTPTNFSVGLVAGETITIEFSDKIVFDATNWQKYIEYSEATYINKVWDVRIGGGILIPAPTHTIAYDGKKTITIKVGSTSQSGVMLSWRFKKGAIKTADGRVLPNDEFGDGYWVTLTFK